MQNEFGVGCLGNMVKRWSWCVTLELRVLTYKDQTQAKDEWDHLFEHKSGPMKNRWPCLSQSSSDLKVSEASPHLFLGNWCFHGTPVCLKVRCSSNISYSAVKPLSIHKHILIYDLLKSRRSIKTKNGRRCKTTGMTSRKNKWNREIQDSASQAYGTCKYICTFYNEEFVLFWDFSFVTISTYTKCLSQ